MGICFSAERGHVTGTARVACTQHVLWSKEYRHGSSQVPASIGRHNDRGFISRVRDDSQWPHWRRMVTDERHHESNVERRLSLCLFVSPFAKVYQVDLREQQR